MKYKLIKTYPGSPKLNTIKKIPNNFRADNDELYCQITNYPEFWQLVVEKDYEILTVVLYNNYDNIQNVFNNKVNEHDLSEVLKEKFHHIHSIKRLSDGEI